jgi:uncharacterized membrane-anchored protein YhcB (DUF1043 family)/DNA-directed RNA polymerase subunit RPC12/RpoP
MMVANVTCPACQHRYWLPEGETGTTQVCPQCRSPFFVGKSVAGPSLNKTMMAGEQSAAPPIKYTCPNCKKPLEAPAELAGTKRHCPFCSQRLQVPAAPSGTPNLNRTMLGGSEITATPGAAHGPPPAGGQKLDAAVDAVRARLRRLTPIQAAIGGGGLVLLVLLIGFVIFRGGKGGDTDPVANAPELEKLKREIEQKQADLERQAKAEADVRKLLDEMIRKNREEEERHREEEQRRLRGIDDEDARASLKRNLDQEQQQRDKERQEKEKKTQQALDDAQRKLEETQRALDALQRKRPTVVVPRPRKARPVAPDPGSLLGFPIGQTHLFQVTGRPDGAVWGTDVYTADSNLATAAVHMGLLRPGQTGVVLVQTVPGQPSYAGSTRYGVATFGYGPYDAAYTISPAP